MADVFLRSELTTVSQGIEKQKSHPLGQSRHLPLDLAESPCGQTRSPPPPSSRPETGAGIL